MDLIEGHLAAWKYLESRGLNSNKRSEEIFFEIFNLGVGR
jgi:UDP-glucose 4-epimerase